MSKNLVTDVKNWTIFQFLGINFSLSLLINPGPRLSFHFSNTFTGINRSVNPTLKDYQKAQLVLNFLAVASQFSPKMQFQFFHFGSQSEKF